MFKSAVKRRKQSGITLIELIITIVIMAIALEGVTIVLQTNLGRSAEVLVQVRAVELAQAYLDEILGKRFDEKTRISGVPPCRQSAPAPRQCTVEGLFGSDGGETRATFDDVDDYHLLAEGDSEGTQLRDAEGNPRNGYDNFSVSISVRYINLGGGEEEENLPVGAELDDQYDAKLITLAVSYRGISEPFYFSAYKSNF